MTITVEAISEAGVLKPLTPLSELPEHTKVRITVEALPVTVPHGSVIDEQRRHRIPLDAAVARDLGDRHEYDLFERLAVFTDIPAGAVCSLDATICSSHLVETPALSDDCSDVLKQA